MVIKTGWNETKRSRRKLPVWQFDNRSECESIALAMYDIAATAGDLSGRGKSDSRERWRYELAEAFWLLYQSP
jgi:hypothetical protein